MFTNTHPIPDSWPAGRDAVGASAQERRSGAEGAGGGAFALGGANVAALNLVVTAIEAQERTARKEEALRLRSYAQLYAVAAREAAEQPPRRLGGVSLAPRPVEESIAYRSAVADLAASLRLTDRSLRVLVEKAHELDTHYPATLDALEAGLIDAKHVNVILETGRVICAPGDAEPTEAAAQLSRYEALVLARAAQASPAQLRPYARRIAEKLTEIPLEKRHEREKARRGVWVDPVEGGMAYLTAYIPAHTAKGIHSRLTGMARQAQQAESQAFGELKRAADAACDVAPVDTRRRLDEIRADLLVDMLWRDYTDPKAASELAGAIEDGAGVPAVQGIVQVIVRKEHLDDAFGEAARQVPLPELEGYGPIAVDAARTIAGRARHWVEVAVDPRSGDVEAVTSRVPSAHQKRKLLARDEHCRWPGCRTPGYRCDIDHTVAVEDGGPTAMNNLGFLCRHHHTLKHHGGWNVRQIERAVYEWTSPTGRVTYTNPESRVRFQSVEDPPDASGETAAACEFPPRPFETEPEPRDSSTVSSNQVKAVELGAASWGDPGPRKGAARLARPGCRAGKLEPGSSSGLDDDAATGHPF